MAKRPTLTDITSFTNSSNINALSQNWDAIEEAFDNTISRDGSTPNTMSGDLDLNGNALLNVGTIDVENLTIDGQTVTDLASVPEWRSSWVTATSYVKNDLVKANGNVYICLVGHTSGTFATDLTALKWELLVTKGDTGAGSGDLIAANNLSELANFATARANLGLGTVATDSIVPIARGGTGATDNATARSNLGLGTVATESILPISKGGTGQALSDPGGQRVLGWDNAANEVAWFGVGSGVTLASNQINTTSTPTTIPAVTLSGTSPTITTAIPDTAFQINVGFRGVSTNGTDAWGIRVGAGTILTSGYDGKAYMGTIGGVTATDRFPMVHAAAASSTYDGTVTFTKQGGTYWFMQGTVFRSDGVAWVVQGHIPVTGSITRIFFYAVGDSFDSGTVYVSHM